MVESYIVRIYRRDEEDSTKLVGLVETVGLEEKKSFKNFEELLAILTSPKGGKFKIHCSNDGESV